MVVFCVGTVAVMFTVFATWILPRIKGAAEMGGSSVSQMPFKDRVESRFPSPSEKQALALVKDAMATRDPENVSALFRTGDFTPQAVVEYLKNHSAKYGESTRFRWLSSMDVENLLLEGVVVTSEREGVMKDRLVFLTPDEKGKWKVDFESLASVCKPSWEKLLVDDAARGVARVKIERALYYNSYFSDDDVWTAYKITCPDKDVTMWAYAKSGTELASSIEDLFYNRQTASRATLEIARVPGAESRQVQIMRVLSSEWVVPSVAMAQGNAGSPAAGFQ